MNFFSLVEKKSISYFFLKNFFSLVENSLVDWGKNPLFLVEIGANFPFIFINKRQKIYGFVFKCFCPRN